MKKKRIIHTPVTNLKNSNSKSNTQFSWKAVTLLSISIPSVVVDFP